MARFLVLWRFNPVAPWPTDPSKVLEMDEKMWAGIEDSVKKGLIVEFGVFPDGFSGYGIAEGETENVYRGALSFQPYVLMDVHEIIPYEKSKEIARALLKAQIETAKS